MLLALALLGSSVLHAGDLPDGDPWLTPDKALHFSVSAGLAIGVYAGTLFVTDDARVRFALGAGLSLVAGAAKELADLAGLGHPSWKDLAWDVAGAFTGAVTALLLDQLLITPLFGQLPAW